MTEQELSSIIEVLNSKEEKVYSIQKEKFKGFSAEIQTFESVYSELDRRSKNTEEILEAKKKKAKFDKHLIAMEENDYESYNSELGFMEKDKENLLSRIGAIERTYPKEFEYLYQDLVLKKELQEVINQRNIIKKNLKYMYEDRTKLRGEMRIIEDEITIKSKEKETLALKIDEATHDVYFSTMENYLEHNVSDIMNFDKFKILTQSKFY